MPDPGDAFIAAGRAFGTAPIDPQPLAIEDERVEWAFGFSIAQRSAHILMWCERARAGASPDGAASDAQWVIFLETLLDAEHAVDDARALAATTARAAGERTVLLYDPLLGTAWKPEEFADLFLREGDDAAALLDERHLYRVELVARDRVAGPYWLATVGLARLGKPELEMLEVAVGDTRAALELIDAVAARLVHEDVPHAGEPFEAGPELRVALVPANEAIETLASDAPGSQADRTSVRGPRAVLCAAGRRGAFKQVWVPPFDELARLTRNEAGLFLTARVSQTRALLAQRSWSDLVRVFAQGNPSVRCHAKISRQDATGAREHVWIELVHATHEGGKGSRQTSDPREPRIEFSLCDLSDWRISGFREDLTEVGPENAALLR